MRTAKIENQNMRQAHEIISAENIGSNVNRGPVIPNGTPVRSLAGVLTNNPGYTALSDAEIEQFSVDNNSFAIVSEKDNLGYYCQLEFYGKFSLDNICYSIMKPCRCVVKLGESEQIITTSRFTAMHSVTKLISRIGSDHFEKGIIYKVSKNGERVKVREITDIELMRNCLKYCEEPLLDNNSTPDSVVEAPNLQEKLDEANCRIEELENRVRELLGELEMKNQKLEEISQILHR